MSATRVLPSLALAFLMAASILAIQPAQAFPVSSHQQSTANLLYSPGVVSAPDWKPQLTTNRFWPMSDPTTGTDPAGAVFFQDGTAITHAALSPDPPTTVACAPDHASQTPAANAGACTTTFEDANDANHVARIDITGSLPGNVARFPMGENLGAQDTYHLIRVEVKMLAACDVGPLTFVSPQPQVGTLALQQDLIVQKLVGGTWTDDRTIASTSLKPDGTIWGQPAYSAVPAQGPYSVQMFRGSSTLGDAARLTGPQIEAGERLVAQYQIDLLDLFGGDVQCFLYYGNLHECYSCDPNLLLADSPKEFSETVLTTDAARLATFTTAQQGPNGEPGIPMVGFPAASSVNAAQRRIGVEALYASAFGPGIIPQLETQRTANARLVDADNGNYVYFVDDTSGLNRADTPFPTQDFPRTFQINDKGFRLISSHSDDPAPTPDIVQDLGNSVLRRSYLFSYNESIGDISHLRAEFYSLTDGWNVQSPTLAIGGRGITFDRYASENGTHYINAKEPTQFSFVVKNIGTQDDQVTVSVNDPGNGWTANVQGGGQYTIRPGGSAIGVVEVIPPASATTGAAKLVTLHAASSFTDVPDPDAVTFTTHITDKVVRQVLIEASNPVFAIKPGAIKDFPVTVTNQGTARDQFVVIPSLPSNIQGFTVTVSPTSIQIPAGARQAITVRVHAPAETTLANFPLGLTAVEVGDSTISSRIDQTVQMLGIEGIVASLLDQDQGRHLRQEDPQCPFSAPGTVNQKQPAKAVGFSQPCQATQGQAVDSYVADTDYDGSGLFRFTINNPAATPASYRVESFWDLSEPGSQDAGSCDGTSNGHTDGIPDGWRYNWDQAVGTGIPPASQENQGVGYHLDGFSGRYQLNGTDNPLVVPAGSTRYVFLEIGHIDVYPCGKGLLTSNGAPVVGTTAVLPNACAFSFFVGPGCSGVAKMVVQITPINDPASVTTIPAVVHMDAPGDFQGTNHYSGGIHNTLVEPDLDAPTSLPIHVGDVGAFNLRAINTGNEHDDIVLRAAGSAGWNHAIQVVGSVPSGIACDDPRADGTVRCHTLGVYDEVLFRVLAQPTDDVPIGGRDSIRVTAASGDASDISTVQDLTARAAGTFAYVAHQLGDSTRPAAPGTTVAFPFLIDNLGTEADTYGAGLTISDPKWSPVLSTGTGIFVPGSHDSAQYLAVTVPTDATLGVAKQFRVRVESATTHQLQTVDFFVFPTAPSRLALAVTGGPDVLIPKRDVATPVQVKATLTSGANVPINLTADTLGLPEGWHVTPKFQVVDLVANSAGLPTGTATFQVTAPSDALSTSRALLRFVGFDASGSEPTLRGITDTTLNLASTFGLDLQGDQLNQTIAPGGDVSYNLTIHNLGLGQDVVRFTHTALPAGWTMLTNPGTASLGPLEVQNVTVKVHAPVTAQPKDIASVLVFATSSGDPTVLDSLPITAQVGFNELKISVVKDDPYGSPQQSLSWVLNVTNTGTLPDQVRLLGVLDTPGLKGQIQNGTIIPSLFELAPGQTKQVAGREVLGPTVPSDVLVQSTVTATSLLDERSPPASASVALHGHVLPYVAKDVNGDGRLDYAVDRNRDPSDGFEEFQASTSPGGRPIALPDLQRFLSDAARDSLSRDITLPNGTVARVLVYVIDGDHDGKADFFLDYDGDNQPDAYWDPDANRASPIEFRKDVNGDQVPEVFVDTDGDGRIDSVFDMTRGTFTNVLQTDVDGDGHLDYVVDKNGNGQVDQDETVLYTRSGKLLIVQKVDVDGDGKLDQVFDTDGDGNPDYFIPNGSTQSVPIVLRDVNGDGVMDWTFDGNNDGRNESYYDPATGESHVIAPAGHLLDALKHYWYIGALFALVLVLFVALVMVTRR